MTTTIAQSPDAKKTVLIVDDAPDNITILASTLSDLYRVKAATSGEKALRMCRSDDPPALVLLDVIMPNMDGYEVCRQLKADPKTADIPVLFVSGLTNTDDEQAGLLVGASDYLTKPVSAPIVVHRVRVHLELAESRRKLQALNRDLATFVSPNVAAGLKSGVVRAEVANRRRDITVFFSDIAGFTPQTEAIDPVQMTLLLNAYFGRMSEIAELHEGTLDKFIGDAAMVLFGAPATRGAQADAQACIAMGQEMQRALDELRGDWRACGIAEPLRVRMGVASGECTVGSFGSARKLEYTAFGSVVNLAARLQAHARPGQLLVSEATHQLLGNRFATVAQPPLTVKGFAAPVVTYEIAGTP